MQEHAAVACKADGRSSPKLPPLGYAGAQQATGKVVVAVRAAGPLAAASAVGSSAAAAVSSKAGNDGLGFSADEVRIDHALTCLVSQLPQPDSVVTRVLHLVSPTLPES